jgi:type IV pilus assembly protein PilE
MGKFATGTSARTKTGFTLVEVMIAVLIVAVLASVAVPNYLRYRKATQMNACISNLSNIHIAYEQAKLAGRHPASVEDISGPGKYLSVVPLCPVTGTNTYSLPATDSDNPTCANSTDDYPHRLPENPGRGSAN